MALIKIPGIESEEDILNVSTEPAAPGLKHFPCNVSGWTRHTGCVLKAEIKMLGKIGEVKKPNIAITVVNSQYGGEILISLDVNDVAPSLTPEQAKRAKERNLETIKSVMKVLGCHTHGQLDESKLAKATGMCLSIGAKHKGFNNDSSGQPAFHKVSYIYYGEVADLLPVDESIGLPPIPKTTNVQSAEPVKDPFANDADVPF
jgi:hypothetical protein